MKTRFLIITFVLLSYLSMTAQNPFFSYQTWSTPHGTYPFNEIKPEHYVPAFEEAFAQGLKDIDDIVNNPEAPTFANTIEAYEKSGKMLSVGLRR